MGKSKLHIPSDISAAAQKDMVSLVELARRDLGLRGDVRVIGSAEGRLSPLSREEIDEAVQSLEKAVQKI